RYRVGERHHAVLVDVRRALAHDRRRQLGEAEGQVLVGAWVIDPPAVAVAVHGVAKGNAAELERAVVRRILADLRHGVAEASARRRGRGRGDGEGDGEDGGGALLHGGFSFLPGVVDRVDGNLPAGIVAALVGVDGTGLGRDERRDVLRVLVGQAARIEIRHRVADNPGQRVDARGARAVVPRIGPPQWSGLFARVGDGPA